MSRIKDLYYGNISPREKSVRCGKDFIEQQNSASKSDAILMM